MIKINLAKPELILGDSLEVLKEMPEESIDLVVTSPPYDNLRTYNGTNDWSFEKFKGIAKELARSLKRGGVIVWNVSDATDKGSESGSSFRQALFFKDECSLFIHDTMIWFKPNYVPKNHARYEHSFEYMFVFSKGKPKTFNPLRVPCKTAGTKRTRSRFRREKDGENLIGVPGYMIKDEKVKANVWEIPTHSFVTGHPAVFPEKLAEDHILSWSNHGDVVLDPFLGSGTTGKMAIKNGRNFIGIEREPSYLEIAKKRLGLINEAV